MISTRPKSPNNIHYIFINVHKKSTKSKIVKYLVKSSGIQILKNVILSGDMNINITEK